MFVIRIHISNNYINKVAIKSKSSLMRIYFTCTLTNLLPEVWLQSQTGAGCNKPAVSHNPLVQVMGADAFHKQIGLLAYLLKPKSEH